MAQSFPETELTAIIQVVQTHFGPMAVGDISEALKSDVPRRTLQHRLKHLVDEGRLDRVGSGRWTRYTHPLSRNKGARDEDAHSEDLQHPDSRPGVVKESSDHKVHQDPDILLSAPARETRALIRRPLGNRTPVGYDRTFLESYVPNKTRWLSKEERNRLSRLGTSSDSALPAGTYASRIMERLLVDLSWNSSRLEGNTYSLLDTRRLIQFDKEAEGKQQAETQMILNHKVAIQFLVHNADEIGFDRRTILNLHAILADNLLFDPSAVGRLRTMAVGIEQSVFHPLEIPQQIAEYFDLMLSKASLIENPFEQALFILIQLPYLQPFDDVNKRVSRIAANIPFVRHNLIPLSFEDVPRKLYVEALLGVYELNRVDLFKDVFIWAYMRSASRYAAVRQSLGEPDPFRLRYRDALREVVSEVVGGAMDRKAAAGLIDDWTGAHVDPPDRTRFREIAEDELLALHEGNFARYRIRPSEFDRWYARWNSRR